MQKNNVVFSAENIISTLGINIQDDYDINFEPDPEAIDITSRFFINKKGVTPSVYSSFFVSDNFENSDNPGYVALLPTKLTQDGVVTLKLNAESSKMTSLMSIVNHYIKLFMIIEGRTGFYASETVNLQIMTHYKHTDVLELIDIKLDNMVLYSVFETNYERKEINIDYVVNEFISKIGFEKIDVDTDIDSLTELVKMQKILEAMEVI
jgi:hypothetical protein